jgi:hypothetical protein
MLQAPDSCGVSGCRRCAHITKEAKQVARIDDYRESFRLAAEELRTADLQHLARSAGVSLEGAEGGPSLIRLSFLGSPYVVEIADGVNVFKEGETVEISLPEKILICHFLLHASGAALTGQPITFRQIPDGHFYFDAFQRRARDPFLKTFGEDLDLFRACAEVLGGKPVDTGDLGMVFDAMPGIPIQLVIWRGDDELDSEATILFDANIQYNLAVEDIAVLSSFLVYRLMGIARSRQGAAPKR